MLAYDITGTRKPSMKVSSEIFDKKVSEKLLAQYVRVYLANQRQGNASTKSRADVNLSKHKIYRQKGTGKARHGAKSAPIFVGGGITFGPKPRDFSLNFNKKQKKSALFGALTLAFQKQNILGLVDSATEVKPKTKEVAAFFKKLNLENKRVLFVLPKLEKNNLVLAARNISNVKLMDARSLNTFEVMKQEKIIFLKNAITVFEEHFLKKNEN
ncbi:50S ribosomal protein L4 [Candidatus Roizmanbacteria bacterium RIFCSPLOWO2_12_FULL_40_12]|uniref:Large ribosomal subunit protein uL4 n=1 Tax=Candidatus Roizmanbacteria bacterium RIFCSPLOWO2_01_FULL_40_42 TaxID=1802066 RepID=A0A1F7J4U4_9BACT|nr:MAG: 50S ribosomal protein L4 [Candidatus Roizmanbacteria bacterium RIFCSPHIGHO2_01_FULL_40_98]OGK27401.1 MAG: 50S ribosomal protein L4 [Candidatus Roizmanbacteria bacterium RIFCSPHIGHO2_02_FULL_40_53]OGK30890.1 MAG: 50S ribosomal protein L4 [Candidatus Roizmanbacteria bacterium RIFCSPHIGHO2_12_41_18]OGK36489.1 MAG: 50S ribosomal protein L4 [Candidatus Roizmanbacteria bacterium RIFCSPHIGHO2_12_FULL_40_130]OGK50635.1 MAG: 50S ribosomal protein L4 [Candidatus Roizmanbacteria bacterium RIFCSPLO